MITLSILFVCACGFGLVISSCKEKEYGEAKFEAIFFSLFITILSGI